MKVLDVYNKNDLDLITFDGKGILTIMDGFFSKFPSNYRNNFDRNLEKLEVFRVDEMPDVFDSASFCPASNILLFKSFAAVPHEFMHMSSSDLINKKYAFCREGIYSLHENGLIEGMTEFLGCMATDSFPNTYFFEYFVVSMLSDIDNIFEPYFIPSYDGFVSLFPNKKDILSLMYALDFYHDKVECINDKSSDKEIDRISDSVRSVIDNLIDIELSFRRSTKERQRYRDKFMDLITDQNIDSVVGDVYEDYVDYAYHEVNKRVLRRK